MPRYKAHFYGRTKGAIGIFYWIDAEIEAETPAAVRLGLYDGFEHIQHLRVEELSDHDDHDQTPDR